MRCLVTLTFAMLFPVLAHATQVSPSGIEYTNDTIEQGGKLAACIVTTAIISPPAPEIVNFQVLVVGGTHAFKVTAGDVDWTNGSGVAKRIRIRRTNEATILNRRRGRTSQTHSDCVSVR
jgi:hypothetical protein